MNAKKQGVHRSTPNSMAGRRMNNIAKPPQPELLTQEQKNWNAQLDAKKAAKKAAKNASH